MTTRQLERLVRAAGREPVERDTLYNVVDSSPDHLVNEGANDRK
jgi:2-iminoacetate synthase ThiH